MVAVCRVAANSKHLFYFLNVLLAGFLSFFSNALLAQLPVNTPGKYRSLPDTAPFCSYDGMLERWRKDPVFRQREQDINNIIRQYNRPLANDTLTLPVVVHIVNPNPFFISDAQVIAGINDLNDAFSKSGAYSASAGVDTKTRFCIAKISPEGGVTTGITRTSSYYGNDLNMDNEDDRLKGLIQWDPTRYINIWLITNIHGEAYSNFSCGVWTRLGVGGYATMPPTSSLDGIVVTAFGKLLAHEMGHYLGLYHTFQGGCNNWDCTLAGDMVCDTPPDGSVMPSSGCFTPGNSCNTDTLSSHSNGNFFTDVPDQISNFMDYGNSACTNQFTAGQAARMRAMVLTQRTGLMQSACVPPCNEIITASFTRDTANTAAGDSVHFANTSIGAINYRWYIDGVLMGVNADFGYRFTVIGKFPVVLKAFNADSTCFAAAATRVTVNCGVTARFFTNKKAVASRLPLFPDSLVFTNASFNGASYEWLVANDQGMAEQVVSTQPNLTYTFPVPGNYTIRLVASNGSCKDTTNEYRLQVLDPTPDGVLSLSNVNCYQQTKISFNMCITNWGMAPLPVNTPVTFYDNDPRLPGAVKLSPTFYLPYQTMGGNCYYCFNNIVVNVPYRGLNRLYAVFNDSGNTSPLVLPNRGLPEKDYTNNVTAAFGFAFKVTATPVLSTLLPGDTLQLLAQASPLVPPSTYLWSDPLRLSCTACSNPQLYADSDRVKRVVATSQYGCTDTTFVTIKVPPANDYTVTMNKAVCASGDSILVNFTVFNSFFRGSIPRGLKLSFYKGDPSTGTAVLLPPVFSVPATVAALQATFNTRIKIMPEGLLYAVVNDSSTGIVPVVLPNTYQLEKLYTNNFNSILYSPIKKTIDTSICRGAAYFGYSASGTYVDTRIAPGGCDSIRTLHLTIKPVFNTSVDTAICRGQNYAGHTSTGIYTDVYAAINGCDSTRLLHLTVKPTFNTIIDTAICQGQQYAGYSASGTHTDIFIASNGCDSTRLLHLIVKPIFNTSIDTAICQGQQYAGHTITGTYTEVFTAINGCDSTRVLRLTVKPAFTTTINKAICQGQQFEGYSSSGTYTDIFSAVNGCDSTRTLHLTVHPLAFTQVTTSICEDENYAGHTASGTYTDVYPDRYGCDSTRTLHLTVKPKSRTNYAVTICETESYAGHTQAGNYIDIFPGSNGCDSIRSLQLAVNPRQFTPLFPEICEGQAHFAAGAFQTRQGIYYDTLPTYQGCDSIVITTLTVHKNPVPALGADRGICTGGTYTLRPGNFSSYLWQDGQTIPEYVTAALGKYYVTVTDTNGCKGSDTILLNAYLLLPADFLPADSNLCKGNVLTIAVPGYQSYLWNNGSTSRNIAITQTGTYRLTVTDKFDCVGTDMVYVYFYSDCIIAGIPNAFSPNGDGTNETFKPYFPVPVTEYTMQLFNRLGQLVFETDRPTQGWDGTYKNQPQDPAAYVYFIRFRDYKGEQAVKRGSFVLIR